LRKALVALSMGLRTGFDYLASLPLEELTEIAKEVTAAHGKRKGIRAGN
jgi:hypothetical protein